MIKDVLSLSDPRSNARKPTSKAHLLGQVLTPPKIANRMATRLLKNLKGVRVLDPCVGKGAFPTAILRNNSDRRQIEFTLMDLDLRMVKETRSWANRNLVYAKVLRRDYLKVAMDGKFDGVIFNPPFVRQEWIKQKEFYRALFKARYNLNVPGTSNLYVYFIVKALQDLKPGGTFCCIVYDSWQSTRFGRWLARYLGSNCEALQVEAVPNSPFQNKLIDATIIAGKRIASPTAPLITPVTGHPSETDSPLAHIEGVVPLREIFSTRRGLRLKQADFFLCNGSDAKRFGATPFLKKVSKIPGYAVPNDHDEAALLLTRPDENREAYEELMRRLRIAIGHPKSNISILTWHRERPSSWCLHRKPRYAPIVFNYYLRHRPRHVYNPRFFYSDNFYGLAPLHEVVSVYALLALMNSTAVCAEILARSRNQGSGLSKIQLFEYREVLIPDPRCLKHADALILGTLGRRLVDQPNNATSIIKDIDARIAKTFRDPKLSLKNLDGLFRTEYLKSRKPK